MQDIQNLYIQFLSNFPENLRPVISLGMVVVLVYAIFKVIKKEFIYLVALIVLLPGSVPILRSVWGGIVDFVKFLITTK